MLDSDIKIASYEQIETYYIARVKRSLQNSKETTLWCLVEGVGLNRELGTNWGLEKSLNLNT